MRALVVDDHPSFRRVARMLLTAAGHEVVGEAADGAEALTLTHELGPDLLLLDIQLPDTDGFAIAEKLADLERPPLVVLVSTRSAADYAERLAGCPVCGFIDKQRLSPETLAGTIGG